MAGRNLDQTLNTKIPERFSSSLNVMAGCLREKLAEVGLNVCECAGKAGSHPGRWVPPHSWLAKILLKGNFWACRPHSLLC